MENQHKIELGNRNFCMGRKREREWKRKKRNYEQHTLCPVQCAESKNNNKKNTHCYAQWTMPCVINY